MLDFIRGRNIHGHQAKEILGYYKDMIYNSSNHPVIVKRIPIKVWTLKDEIYCALKRRAEETDHDLMLTNPIKNLSEKKN